MGDTRFDRWSPASRLPTEEQAPLERPETPVPVPPARPLLHALLGASLLAVAVIDLEHYIVPNRILIPLTSAAVPLLGLAIFGEDGSVGDFVRAGAGGLAMFSVMFALNLISPRGMGMGDVKMSFVLGLYLGFLGWGELVLGFFAAFLLGAVVGLALMVLKRRGRKDAVPFGPSLAAGTVIAALWGEPILRWYTGA